MLSPSWYRWFIYSAKMASKHALSVGRRIELLSRCLKNLAISLRYKRAVLGLMPLNLRWPRGPLTLRFGGILAWGHIRPVPLWQRPKVNHHSFARNVQCHHSPQTSVHPYASTSSFWNCILRHQAVNHIEKPGFDGAIITKTPSEFYQHRSDLQDVDVLFWAPLIR